MNKLRAHNLKIKIYFLLIIMLIVVVVVTTSMNVDSASLEKTAELQLSNLKYDYEYRNFKIDNVKDSNVLGIQSDIVGQSIPVLVYHSINNEDNGTSITEENFKDQMFTLKKAGYKSLSMQEFYDYVTKKLPLPDKSILITFDDGSKDSYYPVDPILKAIDYKATNFIITNYSKHDRTTYYLSASEIKQMIASGRWDIQAHTDNGHKEVNIDEKGNKGYFFSSRMWLDNQNRLESLNEYENRIKSDMVQVKNIIASDFGQENIGFAYPFGDFGIYKRAIPEARKYILDSTRELYKLAFYQYWEDSEFSFSQNYPNQDTFLVKRITLRTDWDGKDLLNYLEKGSAKALPYNDDFEIDNGWVGTWGEVRIENEMLMLETSEKTNGVSAYLDGTYGWNSYVFNAEIGLNRSESLSIIGAYQNNDNYFSCDFSDGFVYLKHKFGGKINKLVELPMALNEDVEKIGIAFKENMISCLLNDNSIINVGGITPEYMQGGIALQAWDSKNNNVKVNLTKIEVYN